MCVRTSTLFLFILFMHSTQITWEYKLASSEQVPLTEEKELRNVQVINHIKKHNLHTEVGTARKKGDLSINSLKVPLITLILVKLVNLKLLTSLVLLGVLLIKKAVIAAALFVPVLLSKLKHNLSKDDGHVYIHHEHEHVDDGHLYDNHRRYYYKD